jgi:hypothetical protein
MGLYKLSILEGEMKNAERIERKVTSGIRWD